MEITVTSCDTLSGIKSHDWNLLTGNDNPFARYEFLYAMEKHDAVGEKYGWIPQYLLAHDADKLVGAIPMYLKYNSYGEFVFDWAWADAYERNGQAYYPKLVVSIPYTPATGNRLLIHPDYKHQDIANILINASIAHAEKLGVSSLHWLFPNDQDIKYFQKHPQFMIRLGCQFHWNNNNYKDFDDYLDNFRSSKRKKIRRERKYVEEQNINLNILSGNDITEEQWEKFYYFYASTFTKKSGIPTFSNAFFQEIGSSMPDNIVLVMADYNKEYVAGAFNMRGAQSLYGRHWGCLADFHSLHFETCYYQGLEYAINNGLKRFEPGAQGEHKISRGFLPKETWSAHWIADPDFKEAIAHFLNRETAGMKHYIDELRLHTPFKDKL